MTAPPLSMAASLSLLIASVAIGQEIPLKTDAGAIADPDAQVGLKESYFAAIGGHYTAGYKINRTSMALVEYCDVFGDQQARQIAAKAARAAAGLPGSNHVCYYWSVQIKFTSWPVIVTRSVSEGQPLALAFGRPSAATPFMPVPVAMWALQGPPGSE